MEIKHNQFLSNIFEESEKTRLPKFAKANRDTHSRNVPHYGMEVGFIEANGDCLLGGGKSYPDILIIILHVEKPISEVSCEIYRHIFCCLNIMTATHLQYYQPCVHRKVTSVRL